MYHIFFIRLSVGEHLGSFYILPMINNAAMNTGVLVSFQSSVSIFFFPDRYPGVELLDHMVVLFLVF